MLLVVVQDEWLRTAGGGIYGRLRRERDWLWFAKLVENRHSTEE